MTSTDALLSRWEEGYRSGAYATPLFPDITPQLRNWKNEGKVIAIYSSGSVFAQKLLMEHVEVASEESRNDKVEDVSGLISGWFDTVNAGLKAERKSYEKIAGELKVCRVCRRMAAG